MAEDRYGWLYRKYAHTPESFRRLIKPGIDLYDKMEMVIVRPSEFFLKIRYEKGLMPTFRYHLSLSVIFLLLTFGLLGSILISMPSAAVLIWSMSYEVPLFWPLMAVGVPLVFLGAATIMWALIGGLAHVIVSFLGGKADYKETFKAVTYAGTPMNLFGWIPVVQIIPFAYSIYLFVRGLSKLQGVSLWKAAGTFAITAGIILISLGTVAFLAQSQISEGSERILGLWDQVSSGTYVPNSFGEGTDIFLVVNRSLCTEGTATISVANFGADNSGPIDVYIDGEMSDSCTSAFAIGIDGGSSIDCSHQASGLSTTGFHNINLTRTEDGVSTVHQMFCN
jgi:hypothetical protein